MRERMDLLGQIQRDEMLRKLWNQLPVSQQQELCEVGEGHRVPNLLNDTIFKGIFDPDKNGERLSRFISCVLGRKVKVLHSLQTEGNRHSIHSKGIILDILAQFEDGSLCDVEVQREGFFFPPQRAAIYSADLVSRQYSINMGETKQEINYDRVRPVYTIIVMEKSSGILKKSDQYIHHFRQISDTGLEMELLQYYDFICLDKFRKKKPHVAGELEQWLAFLSIRDPAEMNEFLNQNQSFQSVYDCAILMLHNRKELMQMFLEMLEKENIAASLNVTNESIIKRMKKENAEMAERIEKQDQQITEQKELLDEMKEELRRLREELKKR